MAKYFTSDLHVGHRNVIGYAKRPFTRPDGEPDVDLMRRTLLDNFVSVLRPGDELYILGDIALNAQIAHDFVRELPGQKFLVWGNHEPHRREHKKRELLKSLFVRTGDIMETRLSDGTKAIMSHYPMLRWNHSHHGSYMLHGHTHGDLVYPYPMRILDVGVDNQFMVGAFSHPRFFPVSEDEIIRYMADKPSIHHHDRDVKGAA